MGKPYWMVLVCAWCSGGAAAELTSEIPKLSWPTDLRARLASGFGERVRGGVKEFHGAIDLGVGHIAVAEDGSHRPVPVFAAEDGHVVHQVNNYGGRGKALVIEHAGKFTTVYGHIDPTVEVGERVTRGQQLGSITRWPGNEHLHFGVHAEPFNPKKPLASTRGVYPTGTVSAEVGVLDPLHHTDYPKELITDVSKQLADFFGGAEKRQRSKLPPPPEPTPVRPQPAARPSEPEAALDLRTQLRIEIPGGYRAWRDQGATRVGYFRPPTPGAPNRGSSAIVVQYQPNVVLPGAAHGALTRFETNTTVGEKRWRARQDSLQGSRGDSFYVVLPGGLLWVTVLYTDAHERAALLRAVRSLDLVGVPGPAEKDAFTDAPASGQRDTEQKEEPDGPLADAFAKARDFTRRWEGGYVNDPDDAGGATNFGITQRTYDRFRKEWGQTSRGVRDISAEEVSTIYQSYWESSGAEKLPAPLSAVHFDSFFHFNPRRAEAWKDDVVKAHPNDPVAAAEAYVEKRIAFRHEKVKEVPSQKKFLKGWLNRDRALMELVTDGAK